MPRAREREPRGDRRVPSRPVALKKKKKSTIVKLSCACTSWHEDTILMHITMTNTSTVQSNDGTCK